MTDRKANRYGVNEAVQMRIAEQRADEKVRGMYPEPCRAMEERRTRIVRQEFRARCYPRGRP